MTNEEKQNRIRPWINPEERVTVHYLDAPDLNTTVSVTTNLTTLWTIETRTQPADRLLHQGVVTSEDSREMMQLDGLNSVGIEDFTDFDLRG